MQMKKNAISQPNGPLVTVNAQRGGWSIVAVNKEAAALGVYPGLTLANARAVVSGLQSREVAPIADRRALNALAESCGRFTPYFAAEGDASGTLAGFYLDISGCEHLFGGEENLLKKLSGYLEGLNYSHRLAIADTPGAAWGIARFGNSILSNIEPDGQQTALAPLPVAALRLSPAVVESLQGMGLRTVNELDNMARGPLTARFGISVLERLDQAFGRRFETITPQRPVPVYSARLFFAEPILHQNCINAALDKLLKDLCDQLAVAHKGARSVLLVGYRTDGTVAKLRIGTARPVCDPTHLKHLFREKLNSFNPAYGIDTVMLVVERTDRLPPEQVSLNVVTGKVEDETERNLDYLLDRLDSRLGSSQVLRLQCKARHVPEHAAIAVPFSETLTVEDINSRAFGPQTIRPLRLLSVPESILVMAPMPDHSPVLFRWRQRPYKVVRAEGPERILPEWWREDPSQLFKGAAEARDYYRLEDEKGTLFWIFRRGLYGPDYVVHWYMHGFFA